MRINDPYLDCFLGRGFLLPCFWRRSSLGQSGPQNVKFKGVFLVLGIMLVGVGGFLGSVLRYLVGGWVHRLLDNPWFPYGTLVVNLVGCLVIGFLGGLADNRQVFSPESRLFVFIGILGGFTTFSSFAYETSAFLNDGQVVAASFNVGLQVLLGLVAVWIGGCLSRLL